MRHSPISLGVVLAILVTGCGGDNVPETAPVSGTVMYLGRPVPGGTVIFHPKDKQKGNPGYGEIQSDGTYTLTTYKKDDGAILGDHTVTVEVFAGQAQPVLPGAEAKTSPIPRIYADPEKTPLKFTVQKGPNTADFTLEKKP